MWLKNLLFDGGVASALLIFSLAIALGCALGKIKLFGISLGVTFVLFVGLACGHFGLLVNTDILHFAKEFGLILFVFSIGLSVGPGFFASFKKEGIRMNSVAMLVVALDVLVACVLFLALAGKVPFPMMVGVLTGATTNTPSLGAAQEALRQLGDNSSPALGYAVAYPIGVVGAIFALILIRVIFKVKLTNELNNLKNAETEAEQPILYSVRLTNPSLAGKTLEHIKQMVGRNFIVSRVKRGESYCIPQSEATLQKDDVLRVLSLSAEQEALQAFLGESTEENWKPSEAYFVSRKIVVTRDSVNGKTLGSLALHKAFGATVTRINRAGIDLVANPGLVLQVGDTATVVGESAAIQKAGQILGGKLKRLHEPNLVTIFVGILLGVLLGSIPFTVGNLPMPVRLGLAGGPLIVAILIGRFGYRFGLVTYTSPSSNLMLREVGICLFLASVGIGAGQGFLESVFSEQGLRWLLCGFAITVVPLLVAGFVARKFLKFNYLTLMGVLSGSRTNPPLLAYSSAQAESDAQVVGYSTVYPLTMFLRILSAQLLVIAGG